VGYDQVTGLGSVNLAQLAAAWPANTGTTAGLIGTTATITASSSSPNVNTNDTFTITVAAASGTAAPTGTVTLQIDGGTAYGGTTTTVAVTASTASGTATGAYQTSFSTAGVHQIIAQYPAGTTFTASAGVVQVTVAGTTSGKGSITLSATPSTLAVTRGSSGTETLTVTPAGGYTGTVILSFDTSNDTALTNLCYNFTTTLTDGNGSVPVTGTAAVSTQLIFDTNASDCASVAPRTIGTPMHSLRRANTAKNTPANPAAPLGVAFAGLLLAGFLGRYSRKFQSMAGVIALLAVGLAVSACGGGGSSSSSGPSDPPKGTYTVTVTGTDSATATITGTTTFTFTIQ
jgi:hypothetical protein